MTEAVDKSVRTANFQPGLAAALALLLVSGAAYRMASAHLSPDGSGIVLPEGTLSAVPLDFGIWSGKDALLSEELIEATDTDDHISRVYTSSQDRGQISLFVGYGVRLRDLAPHRPEVCYSGSGWTLDETVPATWEGSDGETLGSRIHRFHRGGLGTMNMTVLNYYIVDGRYCADVALLRSKAWRKTTSNYVAQVQIACSSGSINDPCEETIKSFARLSADAIRTCLVDGVEKARRVEAASSDEG